jgi:hypothetical protein
VGFREFRLIAGLPIVCESRGVEGA